MCNVTSLGLTVRRNSLLEKLLGCLVAPYVKETAPVRVRRRQVHFEYGVFAYDDERPKYLKILVLILVVS